MDKLFKVNNMQDLEKIMIKDKQKIDFALRQVVELMKMAGLAGLTQEAGEYEINIKLKEPSV